MANITEEEKSLIIDRLSDPIWRLNNLYYIKDKAGQRVKFVPNAPQRELIEAIYVKGIRRFVVLKARQLGISTLLELIAFDFAYFSKLFTAGILDQTQKDAAKKLSKAKFAWENLPQELKGRGCDPDNDSALGWDNGSRIYAGTKMRGDTLQLLHISEWGPIASEDPKRSEEIATGALPAADNGIIGIESTFKGGKGGHFYELIKRSMECPPEQKTDKDFHFFFFPWYADEDYVLKGDFTRISRETNKYFDELEVSLGRSFTQEQRLWYHVKAEEMGIFMLREYPTTVEEAFKAPVDGAIYGDIISSLRAKGRVINYEYDHSYPVFSSWDIGWDDSTSIWLFQIIGNEFHWLWHTKQRAHTAAQMMALVFASEIQVSGHLLPHDGRKHDAGAGLTYADQIEKAGAVNIVIVPRTTNIWDGINALRDILKRSWFRLTPCKSGIESVEAYHTKSTTSGGTVTKDPVHDWSSHDCDAMRTAAEGVTLGLIKTKQALRVSAEPRYPDGSQVSIEDVRQRARRPLRAIYGDAKP